MAMANSWMDIDGYSIRLRNGAPLTFVISSVAGILLALNVLGTFFRKLVVRLMLSHRGISRTVSHDDIGKTRRPWGE